MLNREEYIEQAYLFKSLGARIKSNDPIQNLLGALKQEVLATTQLPMAIDFLLAELNHAGSVATAMWRLPHYFTSFQSYLISASEKETGRFDFQTAVLVLEQEALYKAQIAKPVSLFFYQFETLCRHRLEYDNGLAAMASDPVYDKSWQRWLMNTRHHIGIVDLADLVYVHSQHYVDQCARKNEQVTVDPLLFGEKEGRIALANRHKEPLYLFSALQRHLGYPEVPKRQPPDPKEELIPKLVRTIERMEIRIKLLEDEQREKGIDLSQFSALKNQPGREKL